MFPYFGDIDPVLSHPHDELGGMAAVLKQVASVPSRFMVPSGAFSFAENEISENFYYISKDLPLAQPWGIGSAIAKPSKLQTAIMVVANFMIA